MCFVTFIGASTAGNGLRTERSYDIAGRFTKLDIQKVGELNYRYGIGPRLQGVASPLLKADYRYSGFGRLALPPVAGPALIKTALAAPVRDALGRTVEDARYRYAYTAAGAVESVSDKSGQLLARYGYNSLGQRVAKTVNGATTFTLWQDGNRVAEIDGNGNIQTQYLYLTEGNRATPIAKLEAERIAFIHTDHRGAPIAMTDEKQAIVWRANVGPWRTAQTTGPASLNLRLPGQYYVPIADVVLENLTFKNNKRNFQIRVPHKTPPANSEQERRRKSQYPPCGATDDFGRAKAKNQPCDDGK